MDLYEVKDVTTGINTVKDADNTVRNQVYSFFYGKTKSVKGKTAQYCKKNQPEVLNLIKYALSTVSNVLALGGTNDDLVYKNNREELLKALGDVTSGSKIPRVEDFFIDSLKNPKQVEVFYPNFVWDDEYLPIRIPVARGLLVKYYNMIYAYFDNWKKAKEELYKIEPKKETTENTTNQKANESKTVVKNRKFLMEAEQNEEALEGLDLYKKYINEYKESSPTTEQLDELKTSFNEAFSRINGMADVKTFGLSRQLGIFPPGEYKYGFRIEFGDDISARDKMTLLFKMPSEGPEAWLNTTTDFYKNYAVKIEKDGIENVIKTDEKSVALEDSAIKSVELEINGKKETVYYVVVPENTDKVVLGGVENKVRDLNLNKISKDLIRDLKEGEVAYQVNKETKKLISFENETGAKLSEEKRKELTGNVLKDWLAEIKLQYELSNEFKSYVDGLTLLDLLKNYTTIKEYPLLNTGIKDSEDKEYVSDLIEARANVFKDLKQKAFITKYLITLCYMAGFGKIDVRCKGKGNSMFKLHDVFPNLFNASTDPKSFTLNTYNELITRGGENLKNYFYKSNYVAAVFFESADKKKYFINLNVKLGELANLTEGSDKLLDPIKIGKKKS